MTVHIRYMSKMLCLIFESLLCLNTVRQMWFQLTTLVFRATLRFHLLLENLALSTLWSCSTATVAMTTHTEKPLWKNEALYRVVHERESICIVSLPLALVQGRAVQLIRCWSRHTHSRQGLSPGFQLSINWNAHTSTQAKVMGPLRWMSHSWHVEWNQLK